MPEGFIRFVGVDVSARKGLDVAELDGSCQVVALLQLRPDPEQSIEATAAHLADRLADLVVRAAGRAVVAVDAPQAPRLAPRLRECDRDLRARHISLYQVPRPEVPLTPNQAWLRVGFELFVRLRAVGLRTSQGPDDFGASLLEVYPYAGFVTLLGRLPVLKTSPEGLAVRREALRRAGVSGMPDDPTHDALDALVAALTALRHARGEATSVGDSLDGYLTLPVVAEALLLRYHRARALRS